MATNSQSHQPFRFLDLPLELRDQIYSLHFEPTIVHTNQRTHIDTALLKVNREIHDEAQKVMCKELKFIHVVTNVPDELSKLLTLFDVPFVCSDLDMREPERVRVTGFKHFVMEIRVWLDGGVAEPFHLMIMAGKLHQWFSEAIRDFDTVLTRKQLATRATLLDPFGSPSYSAKFRTILMMPIAECWAGFRRFELAGCVEEDKRRKIQGDINKDRWTTWQAVLADYHKLRAEALRVFLSYKTRDTVRVFRDATVLSRTSTTCDQSDELKTMAGSQWDAEVEGFVNFTDLVSCVACLFCAVEDIDLGPIHGDRESASVAVDAAMQALTEMAVDMRGTQHWTPSTNVLAKFHHRTAIVHSLLCTPSALRMACYSIRYAYALSPRDNEIENLYDELSDLLAFTQRLGIEKIEHL